MGTVVEWNVDYGRSLVLRRVCVCSGYLRERKI